MLRARADALARPVTIEASDGRMEIVEFELARTRYGVASSSVRSAHPLDGLTPLPCTPRFVRGIVNVRGTILSVIDIAQFFDLPAGDQGADGDDSHVIVLDHDDLRFGIRVDRIAGVRSIERRSVQPAPATFGAIAGHLEGITDDGIALLNATALLADPRLVVHEEVGR
ncbi:MAG: chemotaxis protein CheW [Burkholderiales bacterium]|nr:chemotaxis protein CheW [Burkholderiales bacterium]